MKIKGWGGGEVWNLLSHNIAVFHVSGENFNSVLLYSPYFSRTIKLVGGVDLNVIITLSTKGSYAFSVSRGSFQP